MGCNKPETSDNFHYNSMQYLIEKKSMDGISYYVYKWEHQNNIYFMIGKQYNEH